MPHSYPDPLSLSRRVLRALGKLNLLMGALILALLIASLISEADRFDDGQEPGQDEVHNGNRGEADHHD